MRASDRAAGRTLKCVKCGAPVVVPNPDDERVKPLVAVQPSAPEAYRVPGPLPRRDALSEDEHDELESERSRRRRQSAAGLWLAVSGIAAALLLALLSAIWFGGFRSQPIASNPKQTAESGLPNSEP